MSDILLTGGTGFLGSHLVHALISTGHKVTVLKRSFSDLWRLNDVESSVSFVNLDEEDLDLFAIENSFDIIIHCATNYGRQKKDPFTVIDANLLLPLKLISLAKRMSVHKFINTDTILDKGINYYSLSKSQFRDWMSSYSHKLVCINISLEHFYGPLDDSSKFITYIIENLKAGVDEISLTEGKQKRDFIFISDVVNAFVAILDGSSNFPPGYYDYEVGSGSLISIKELVMLLKKLTKNMKTKLDFGALEYRSNEVMESHVNLENIKKFGWTSIVSLEEGLLKTIESEGK